VSKRATSQALVDERPVVRIKFGGWYDGDNHKPGRGWYFVCRCGHVGLGQILRQSAIRQWDKHKRRCDVVKDAT
jgi:hypothetical protein